MPPRHEIASSRVAVLLMTLLAACAAPPPAPGPAPAPASAPAAPPSPSAPPADLARRNGPPLAEVRPVTETFFGRSVTDPYRYLEDVTNPEVAAYMKAQSAYARATLDAIPGRQGLLERINKLTEAGVSISGVQVVGTANRSIVFYYKLSPGESMRKLYMRDGYAGPEKLVFDADTLSTRGKRYALDEFEASPDGAHVVVAVAAGGSEETSIRIIDTVRGRDTGLVIDRVAFAEHIRWAPDSKSFFYTRLPDSKPGDAKNRYLLSRAYRHVLGRPVDKDEALFGRGIGDVPFLDIDIPSVQMADDGKFLIGRIQHGDLNELSLYVAPTEFGATPKWRKAIDTGDQVTDFAVHDRGLYLLTHKDAPRYKLVRTYLEKPDFTRATTVIPHGDTVLMEIAIAKDALYVRELRNGLDQLQRLNFSNTIFSGGKLEYLRLPFDLAIRQLVTSPTRPGALLRLEGWTEPPRYALMEERSGNLIETPLQPKSAVDFSSIDEVRLMVTARDGTKVPVSLMYRKGTVLNADNPTLLRAYGAYGISQTASFNPATLAWLERGGIIGTCHVRGGGEFGDEWHKAGQKLRKPNTWRDLIDCAEFLIERKFTRKEKLAIYGGSAGGITVGRALTERPDLFAAVVPAVGVLDPLRMESTPNGPPNVPEFGSATTEDGFNGLYAMSSLHHVKDGVDYPAVLLLHGANDPRVEVWNSTKMAARLQAATARNPLANPVLLRLDYDAGHGIGSTRIQRNAETADIYAFLLWQFGDAAFQPR